MSQRQCEHRADECDCTDAVLQGAASRICLKQHAASLCCSHFSFSPRVSLNCHAIVVILPQLGRIPLLSEFRFPYGQVCWHRFQ